MSFNTWSSALQTHEDGGTILPRKLNISQAVFTVAVIVIAVARLFTNFTKLLERISKMAGSLQTELAGTVRDLFDLSDTLKNFATLNDRVLVMFRTDKNVSTLENIFIV